MPNPPELQPGGRWDASAQFSLTCPRCGTFSRFEIVANPPRNPIDDMSPTYAAVRCERCRGDVSFELQGTGTQSTWNLVRVFPAGGRTAIAAAPESVQASMDEAFVCASTGATMAGALVTRRALQLIARDQGVASGTLKTEIDAMDLPGALKTAAHHVRVVANEAAHPDPVDWDAVSGEELKELIDLTVEIIHYLYELPQRIARLGSTSEPPTEEPAG